MRTLQAQATTVPERRRKRSGDRETRTFELPQGSLELRDNGPDADVVITGSPIRADVGYTVKDAAGLFTEVVTRRAVADIVRRADAGELNTCMYVGHNTSTVPLAATRSKTLRFRQDPKSGDLIFNASIDPRSSFGVDAALAVSRGDLSGCSIGFCMAPEDDRGWNASETERTIDRVTDLVEFSLVQRPAATQTWASVAQRSATGRTTTRDRLAAELEELVARRGRHSLERARFDLDRIEARRAHRGERRPGTAPFDAAKAEEVARLERALQRARTWGVMEDVARFRSQLAELRGF